MTQPTATDLQNRVNELEQAINGVLDQQMDDICWLDVYQMLGGLVGREYNPLKLPKHIFKINCDRFADHLYDGLPYDKNLVTRVVAEHHAVKQMLREAGFGVTGTPLLDTVKEALDEVRSLRNYAEDMRQQGMDTDIIT